jgi:hypothetical protein
MEFSFTAEDMHAAAAEMDYLFDEELQSQEQNSNE